MKYLNPDDDVRLKKGLKWPGSTKPKRMIQKAEVLRTVFLFTLFVVLVLNLINHIVSSAMASELTEAVQVAESSRMTASKAEALLLACMNGGAMYDKTTGKAWFCSKPYEVKL